jgi:hypothetical protein
MVTRTGGGATPVPLPGAHMAETVDEGPHAFSHDMVLTSYAVGMTAKTAETQRLLAALDEELAASAKHAGTDLVWSAAEKDILGMIGAAVDRRMELSEAYEACESMAAKLKVATELRLTEQAIARLYKQVSTDLPAPMSVVSQKAQRAANARWDRERMKRTVTAWFASLARTGMRLRRSASLTP